jgi:hypothetical protein
VSYYSPCRLTVSTNCNTKVNNNQGCGTQASSPTSYGQGFNSLRGGFYALARSKEYGIKVWFWQRADLLTPPDVRSGEETVNPDLWGTPTAYFPTEDNCRYEEYFDAHRIIFDLTFCVRPFLPRAYRGIYLPRDGLGRLGRFLFGLGGKRLFSYVLR